jgi:hypothetical protein
MAPSAAELDDRREKAKAFLRQHGRTQAEIDAADLVKSHQFTGWFIPKWIVSWRREQVLERFPEATLWPFLRYQGYVSSAGPAF